MEEKNQHISDNPHMNKELLELYFSGKADRDLKGRIIEWANASEENTLQFIQAKADWSLQHFPDEPADADDLLRFTKRIDRLAEIKEFTRPAERRKKISRKIYRIAAVVAIPLLLALSVQTIRLSQQLKEQERNLQIAAIARILPPQTQTLLDYVINPGVKGKVLLPDSSEVWLNSNSVLHCPNRFDSLNRIVELEGEGYFKIKGNKEWPFYIYTRKGVSVKVTGTEFNLSSYDNDPFLKITLIEGKVALIDNESLQSISLQPMEELVLQNNEFKQAAKGAAKKLKEDTSWKEGFLLFDNTPIDVVIRKMERWFGVTVSVKDSQINDFRITAEFENESLIQVLEILKISSDVQYRVDGNHVSLHL